MYEGYSNIDLNCSVRVRNEPIFQAMKERTIVFYGGIGGCILLSQVAKWSVDYFCCFLCRIPRPSVRCIFRWQRQRSSQLFSHVNFLTEEKNHFVNLRSRNWERKVTAWKTGINSKYFWAVPNVLRQLFVIQKREVSLCHS